MKQKKVNFYFDESGFNKSSLSLLCCVVVNDAEKLKFGITQLKDDILHNPRLKGVLGNFHVTGFHHAENHFEIRNIFVDFLSRQTFEAFICFDASADQCHRNEVYDKMFGRLLFDRFQAYRDHQINIYFEQHDSKGQKRLAELKDIASRVSETVVAFQQKEELLHFSIFAAGKDELCLSVPDYICSIFAGYHSKFHSYRLGNGEPLEKRNFDALRGKIRLIHDFNSGEFFSRNNPYPDMP